MSAVVVFSKRYFGTKTFDSHPTPGFVNDDFTTRRRKFLFSYPVVIHPPTGLGFTADQT